MQFRTRWIGEAARTHALVHGELFAFTSGPTTYLAMKVKYHEDEFALVLREMGGPSGDPVPRIVDLSALPGGEPVRRITGEIALEPVSDTAEEILAADVSQPVPSGALGLFEDEPVILYREKGEVLIFSLKTGKGVSRPANGTYVWVRSWRLMWRDGEDAVELCNFGGGSA